MTNDEIRLTRSMLRDISQSFRSKPVGTGRLSLTRDEAAMAGVALRTTAADSWRYGGVVDVELALAVRLEAFGRGQ